MSSRKQGTRSGLALEVLRPLVDRDAGELEDLVDDLEPVPPSPSARTRTAWRRSSKRRGGARREVLA